MRPPSILTLRGEAALRQNARLAQSEMASMLARSNFACLRHQCTAVLATMRVSRGLIHQPCQSRDSYQRISHMHLSAYETTSGTAIPRPPSNIVSQDALQNTSQDASQGNSQDGPLPLLHPTNTLLNSLPVSPLVDSSFMYARSKWSQPKPKRSAFKPNRFRRKIANNPFAQILATPDRFCPVTKVHIPRGCLQSFKLTAHPSTGAPWWVPSDLLPAVPQDSPLSPDGSSQLSLSTSLGNSPTAYTLPRIDLLRGFVGSSGRYRNGYKMFLRTSSKPGLAGLLNTAVWREDMDVHILELMRRRIYEDLDYIARLSESENRRYLVPLADPAQLSRLYQKGCVLFIPGGTGADELGQEWTCMSLPVYSLHKLLGPMLCEKLRSEHPVLRTASTSLVRGYRTLELQKRLWKIYGFSR